MDEHFHVDQIHRDHFWKFIHHVVEMMSRTPNENCFNSLRGSLDRLSYFIHFKLYIFFIICKENKVHKEVHKESLNLLRNFYFILL